MKINYISFVNNLKFWNKQFCNNSFSFHQSSRREVKVPRLYQNELPDSSDFVYAEHEDFLYINSEPSHNNNRLLRARL